MKQLYYFLWVFLLAFFQMNIAVAQNSGCGDFHASNDTVVFSGSSISISATGSVSGEYEWLPQSLYGPLYYTRPTQTVTVTSDTFFVVRGYYEGQNLVVNGNFSSGNSGFTSAYLYVANQGSQALWNESTYAVGTNSSLYHSNFGNHTDHTTGTGNFMIVNGSPTANTIVWQQTITVTPQTNYVFQAWVQSLSGQATAGNPAELQFSVNSSMLDPVINASTVSGQWNVFQTEWFSGTSSQANIKIVNQNTIANGNDFGLDDIAFIPWLPCYDTIHVTLLTPVITHNDTYEICQGDTLNVTPTNNDTLDSHCTSNSVNVVQQPHHGTASFNGNLLTAVFDDSFSGMDSLQYALCCDTFCSIATVYVTIHPKVNISVLDTICAGGNYNKYGFVVSEASTQDGGLMQMSHSGQTAFGCDSVFNLSLTITPTVTNIIQSSSADFCDNFVATLKVVSPLQNYVWSTGDSTQEIEITAAGTYSVTASGYGCERDASFSVQPCDFTIYLPNTITPSNADGLNDYLYISEKTQSQIDNFSINMYNRWGELCFSSTDKNFHWDGTEKGKLFPNTIYHYVIRCTNLLGRQLVYRGSITVL